VAGGEGRDHDVGHVDLLEGRGGEKQSDQTTAAGHCRQVPSPLARPREWTHARHTTGLQSPSTGEGTRGGVPRLYLDLLLQEVDFVLLLDELLLLLGDLAEGRQWGSAGFSSISGSAELAPAGLRPGTSCPAPATWRQGVCGGSRGPWGGLGGEGGGHPHPGVCQERHPGP